MAYSFTRHESGALCEKNEEGLLFPVNEVEQSKMDEYYKEKELNLFLEYMTDDDYISDALCDINESENYPDLLKAISNESPAMVGIYIIGMVKNQLRNKAKKESQK